MTNCYDGCYVNSKRGINIVPDLKPTLFVFLFLFISVISSAQKQTDDVPADEIIVSLEVKGVGNTDIPALVVNNTAYLAVTNVFDFIKFRNVQAASLDTITGFLMDERDVFLMDKANDKIFYQGHVYDVSKDGFLKNDVALYLNLKYFKSIFGINGEFYFRRLVVTMSADYEFPVIRENRMAFMRKNLNRLKGDVKGDTLIRRSHPFFHMGMADWAVMSSQQSEGADQTTVNLGLGAALAGGEANVSLNYYSQTGLIEKSQYYQWRYVNNDLTAMRQVVAGKIFTQATSSLYAPVVGVQVTNAPTTYRQSYGTYRLSNTTEPNWTVELYVNDVLVDYTKADGSGFYTFDVPLVYGFTIVKLKFYGPYGEVRTSQQYINIPFNFLPKKEFEYSVSGGIVEDGKDSKFSRLNMNYGVSSKITVGGGVEYLSSVTSGNTMPFVSASFRIGPRMMFAGSYTYGVRSRGILSYRFPKGLQIDLDYINYTPGQTAIYFNYRDQKKIIITSPIHMKKVSLFTRLTVDQISVPLTQYTNTEWSIIGYYHKLGVNLSSYASIVDNTFPYLYSIGSVFITLPAKFLFSTQVQYDFKSSNLIFAKFLLQKQIFGKGYLDFSYQEFFNTNNRNFLLGLRYDFSFSRITLSALSGTNNTYSRVEAASGSIIADHKSRYLDFNNRTNVGKGGIVIKPFLDLNANEVWDADEPRAPGLKIRINGGRITYDDKDTIIRIVDLEPYTKYIVELDRSSFETITWQIKKKVFRVEASPNGFTNVEVPITIFGEISGTVTVQNKEDELPKGQGQITVCIYDKDTVLAGKTITESDGYFSYLGLKPGSYTVTVDTSQLRTLHLSTKPILIEVKIKTSRDGDVADGVEFVMRQLPKDTLLHTISTLPNAGIDAGSHSADSTQKEQLVIGKKGSYAILVEVYGEMGSASVLKSKLTRAFNLPVSIIQDGDDYKVEMVGFPDRAAAKKYLPRLKAFGFPEALIITLKETVFK